MNRMTINDLCELFDRSEIVNNQMEIDREYYASSSIIFSDGNVNFNVTRDGYIHITSVQNASYVIFIDIEKKIYLCVYKYLPNTMYKAIKQKLQVYKIAMNKLSDLEAQRDITNDIFDDFIDDDVIDINKFTCTECDSPELFDYTRSANNPELLICKCNECKAEYTLVPSKYYKLASKRTIYFKSDKSSRQVEIK